MESQAVRDVFLEALAELSDTDDSGLFAHVVYQLTDAIKITETDVDEVRIDATALVEGALEAMAVLGGAWAAELGVTLQVAAPARPGGPTSHRLEQRTANRVGGRGASPFVVWALPGRVPGHDAVRGGARRRAARPGSSLRMDDCAPRRPLKRRREPCRHPLGEGGGDTVH
jgi:hypothetical protein